MVLNKHLPSGRTATLVVAASDSSAKGKANADYVCDGTDDQVEIQAAIDALPAGGGKVVLLEGIYIFSDHILLNKAVCLSGQGMSVIKVTDDYSAGNIVQIWSDNIEIDNIYFNIVDNTAMVTHCIAGTTAGDFLCRNVSIHNCHFKAVPLSGHTYPDTLNDSSIGKVIDTGWSKDWRISDNIFEGYGYEAVSATVRAVSAERITVVNNVMDGGYGGIVFERQAFYCTAVGNSIRTRLGDGNSYGVLVFDGAMYCVVNGNTIYTMRNGIAVENSSVVVGNSIRMLDNPIGAYSAGIYLANAHNCSIVGNTIWGVPVTTGAARHGIYIVSPTSNVLIEGNVLIGSKHSGIKVDPGSNNLKIIGNIIRYCGYAGTEASIYLRGDGNLIQGNTCDGSHFGVLVYGDDNRIVNNFITDRSADHSTTLSADASSGEDIISVSDSREFSIGEKIRINGGSAEDKIIKSINYRDNEITLDSNLGNDHLSGGTVVGVRQTSWAMYCYGATATIISANVFDSIIPNMIGADAASSGQLIYEQYYDVFMDCLAASTNHVHAAMTGTGAEQEITTGITNPDVPRNISITTTNNASPSGDVKITGVDAKGNSVTEDITIVPGGTAYGNVAFATVSKITIPAGVSASDTVAVGISDKLGLSNVIYETGDVYKVKKNNADATIGTVNATYGTVDCATINAGDDFTIYYRSNLNIIS